MTCDIYTGIHTSYISYVSHVSELPCSYCTSQSTSCFLHVSGIPQLIPYTRNIVSMFHCTLSYKGRQIEVTNYVYKSTSSTSSISSSSSSRASSSTESPPSS